MLELVTGGSGSGKSAYAEEHICRIHRILSRKAGRKLPLFYIAAMIPRGEETLRKIERHRKMRETKGFQTLEWHTDIAGKIREKSKIGVNPASTSASLLRMDLAASSVKSSSPEEWRRP